MKDNEFVVEKIRSQYTEQEHTELDELKALGSLAMVVGIAVGLVGMVLVALAYPLYNRVLAKQRARIAPQILELTAELLK